MSIDIEKIANTSRIFLSDDEKVRVKKKLEEVMAYVEIINKSIPDSLDIKLELTKNNNVMREDIQKISTDEERAQIIKNAPKSIENLFVVPLLVKRID